MSASPPQSPTAAHGSPDAESISAALERLETDPERGLGEDEAARRLLDYGPNAIQEKRVSVLVRFVAFFWGPIPWMIEIAAALSAAVRHWEDFFIILAMLLINAGVGFWEEYKADNAIAALRQRLALRARVLRGGRWIDLEARNLVPGDIVIVRLGNIVPADLKLIAGEYLSVDQSALTGESLPVDKGEGDLTFSGSIVRMGEMRGLVVATAMNTFFGRTARLVEAAERRSHFQEAVLKIGNFLILSTLALVAVILTVALFRHDPLVETLLFALILTVAAIPVALPAVLSVTMAVGAAELAKLRAIVSRLVSIEEMAGMDVLCSDKTGTLTQNRLAVGEPIVFAGGDVRDLMVAAALASRSEGADTIDAAVLDKLGDADALKPFHVVRFTPFDPVRKRTQARVMSGGATFEIAKGAPQVILDLAALAPSAREQAEREVAQFAARGYRTLGVARTDSSGTWEFLGLLPLSDPPREDSASTIARARAMGLEVRMVTGDNSAIAREISRELGLGTNIVVAGQLFAESVAGDRRIQAADGFAEVFPEHKFAIVKALQAWGHIVGMTGDGVNDAPALKQADVGIAVSGSTDAARAASDLVLTAPGLSAITTAIGEARRIFERMTSYAVYRIAETIRVLLFMTLCIALFHFYPVTAAMIVLIAVLNDLPIMTIAYDNQPVASRPVRWEMDRVLTISSVLGVTGVISSFALFWAARRYFRLSVDIVQTVIFLKLLVAGHLTIYLTRNVGTIWQRPWPNWRLVLATESTQVFGTLAAVYGWFVAPIGWNYALAIWAYSLVWFFINSGAKIGVYHLMRHGPPRHRRHLTRIGTSLHGPG